MKKLVDVIRDAEKRKVAVGHFNVGNLEQLTAVARAARALDLPVIVGVSEGEREYFGIHHLRDIVASYNAEHARESGFRLFLNADHTHDPGKVREAARLGFDAILFDGGKLPFKQNVALTRSAVHFVKKTNPHILVEGELGYIGSGSEVHDALPEGVAVRPEDLTTPDEAALFVVETGVDLLAPAVGSIHGLLKNAPKPRLDIKRIKLIRLAANVPLVLHGGSGLVDEDFLAAIDAGVSVIHISTELRVAWRTGVEEALAGHPAEVAPPKLMPEVIEKIEHVVLERLKLFNRLP